MIANDQQIKASMSMAKALELLGVQVDRNHRAPCPVHQGKDPNFAIKDGFGHCHSKCGRSWDVPGLLMEVHSLTYVEAIEWIAEKTGHAIEREGFQNPTEQKRLAQEARSKKEALARAASVAADYFQSLRDFPAAGDAIDVDGRTLSLETLDAFRIGRAPLAGGLAAFAKTRDVGLHPLLELGLVKEGDRGDYDMFRGQRLMLPHLDERARVLGFAARLKPGSRTADSGRPHPKYINSSGSELYQKGSELYGLFQNKRDIRQAGYAVLVEGPFDVITPYDQGLRLCVATQGTALTREHAYQLKRYTETVYLLRDADDAGLKAAARDADILIQEQLNVRFVELPAGQDPDSYCRTEGQTARGLRIKIEEESEDALLWRVRTAHGDGSDVRQRETAYRLAATLISFYDSDVRRSSYLNDLCGRGKVLASGRSTIAELVDAERTKRAPKERQHTPNQELHAATYGIHERNNCYYAGYDVDNSQQISNFVIVPLMLIVDEHGSKRLLELRNVKGSVFTLDVDTDALTEITTVKKVVEARGNFVFNEHATSATWTRIKRKLYDDMLEAFPLGTLGWNENGKFWAWANGITFDGKFLPVDKRGIVQVNGIRYFLPEHSELRSRFGDQDQRDVFAQNFIFNPDAPPVDFKDWSALIIQVFGEKGAIGIAYFLAALHRSVFYPQKSIFPHLNLFGPPGSGKSYLAWRLRAPFGLRRQPLHIDHSTPVAFYREPAKARDAIHWVDELNGNTKPDRIEACKSFYDGVGRVKGTADHTNTTQTTKVLQAMILSGQIQPVADVALFTRCISLNFQVQEITREQRDLASQLEKMEEDARLTQLIPRLLEHRREFERRVPLELDRWREKFSAAWPPDLTLPERLGLNYAILLTAAALYAPHISLGFHVEDELLPLLVETGVGQAKSMSEEDDLGTFWDYVAYGISRKHVTEDDFQLLSGAHTLKGPNGEKVTIDAFAQRHVAIRLSNVYRFYRKRLTEERGGAALNQNAIKHYLHGSAAYVGSSGSIRINGKVTSAMVFKLALLPDELGIGTDADT